MALIVFLRGVNVGGFRTFRPSVLARDLAHLGVVNIGAAGTFVVRAKVSRTELREELSRRLPFAAETMICSGDDLRRLAASDPFRLEAAEKDIVRFVSVVAKRRPLPSRPPGNIPSSGKWCVKILGQQGPFVFGLYRREMKAIGYLSQVEKIVGGPVTTRNWTTILAILRALE